MAKNVVLKDRDGNELRTSLYKYTVYIGYEDEDNGSPSFTSEFDIISSKNIKVNFDELSNFERLLLVIDNFGKNFYGLSGDDTTNNKFEYSKIVLSKLLSNDQSYYIVDISITSKNIRLSVDTIENDPWLSIGIAKTDI